MTAPALIAEARRQVRWLYHAQPCPYWRALEPKDCACHARPVIDLLLEVAA